MKSSASNQKPQSSSVWRRYNAASTTRVSRWHANANASDSSVLPSKYSVCSSRNPPKPPDAREKRCRHCGRSTLAHADHRHSENTVPHRTTTIQHRASTVSAVDTGFSSSSTGQLVRATATPRAFYSGTFRVLALLIRRSLVRAQVGEPPYLILSRAIAAPRQAVADLATGCICRRAQLADADLTVQALRSAAHYSQQREQALA